MTKQTVKRGRKPIERDARWVELGRKLVALRETKGWKAYEVARMIGVDPATISQIENGRRATGPERETLELLADLHQIPIDSLTSSTGSAGYVDTHARAEGGPPARGYEPSTTTLQRADILDAVQEALFIAFGGLLETLSTARRRAATEPHREAGGLVAREPRRSGGRG